MLKQAQDGEAVPTAPDWLLQMVAQTRFVGNVRELRNIAERVLIIHRQLGEWERSAIDRVFILLKEMREDTADPPLPRKKWDMADRERIVKALDTNNWRRQDTANYLGISRKVLWEKMRKFQIVDTDAELLGELD